VSRRWRQRVARALALRLRQLAQRIDGRYYASPEHQRLWANAIDRYTLKTERYVQSVEKAIEAYGGSVYLEVLRKQHGRFEHKLWPAWLDALEKRVREQRR
jgi:hypothetical protein